MARERFQVSWILLAGVGLLILVVALLRYGSGWSQKKRAGQLVQEARENLPPAGTPMPETAWSIPADIGTMILVAHTNDQEVAAAVARFWQEREGSILQVGVTTNMLQPEPGSRYLVVEPFNGVVEIDGPVKWDESVEERMTSLAARLSEWLETRAAVALVGPQAASGLLAVYESGERRFLGRRTLHPRGDRWQAVVHVDGAEWAKTTTDFEPSPGGYPSFTMQDANQLVQALGLDLTGAPLPAQCLVLKEP